MDVLITGLSPGKLIEDIACYVEYADEPIYLHVEADIKVWYIIYQNRIKDRLDKNVWFVFFCLGA